MKLDAGHARRGALVALVLVAAACAQSSLAADDGGVDASALVDMVRAVDGAAPDLAPPADLQPPGSDLTTVDAAGGAGLGEPCGESAGGAACTPGLACCYPCGQPGCMFRCQTPCQAGPGCENGCLLVP